MQSTVCPPLRPAIAGSTPLHNLRREPLSPDMQTMLDDIERASELETVRPAPTAIPVPQPPPEVQDVPAEASPKRHHLRRHAHHVMTAGHLVLEAAEMTNVLAGAIVGGVAGSVALSVGMFALGTSHIVEGCKQRSVEHLIEGTGASVLGVKSGLSALHHAGLYHYYGWVASAAHAAHSVLVPLGVAHGLIEAGLGGKRVYDGMKTHDSVKTITGLLGISLGCTTAIAVLGGGFPGMVLASAFFAGKVLVEENPAIQRFIYAHDGATAPTEKPPASHPTTWSLYTD